MIIYFLYALLIALAGTLVLFLLKQPYLYSHDERRLLEASKYTIIDLTPDGC